MTYYGSFLAKSSSSAGRADLEGSGKILLPQSVLFRITAQNPDIRLILFKLCNPLNGREAAVGVESFISDEITCIIPGWIMTYLALAEDDKVNVQTSSFASAKSVFFQPHTSDFLNLPNPKVILEYSLRKIPCLTQGMDIPIEFNTKVYQLRVLKTEPASMVSIVFADVVTDFARPLDQFDHHWGEEEDFRDDPQSMKNQFPGVPRSFS